MSTGNLRQLKIKTASVRRIQKELTFYESDAVREEKRLENLRASGLDQHGLQQAENVLLEAKAMIPDSKQRLEAAIHDLRQFLTQESEGLEDTEPYTEAHALLSEVHPLVL